MRINRFVRCVTACAVAVPLHALAESLNAKPGAWEMTTTSVTTGMPVPAEALAKMPPDQRAKMEQAMNARSGKPTTDVSTSCVTKQELDEDRMMKSEDDRGCTRKVISKTATRFEFEQTCAAPRASTSKMSIEARTPESLVATMDIVQGGSSGRVRVDIKGRWLGASCAGIKD